MVSSEACAVFLKNDPVQEAFENNHQWEKSFFYCLKNWEENPTDSECFLRILLQSWYLLTFDDQLMVEKLPNGRIITHSIEPYAETCRSVFWNTYEYGETYFQEDARYLFLIGTLMVDWPFWFLQKGDHDREDGERRGYERLMAFCASPDSLRYPAIRERILGIRTQVTEEEQEQLFPGNTAINLYFQERLEIWHYLEPILQKFESMR